jgi:hypothetical protein
VTLSAFAALSSQPLMVLYGTAVELAMGGYEERFDAERER